MPLAASNGQLEERRVICWEWKGNARDEGEAAAQWVSEVVGQPSRLVRFIGKSQRTASQCASAAAQIAWTFLPQLAGALPNLCQTFASCCAFTYAAVWPPGNGWLLEKSCVKIWSCLHKPLPRAKTPQVHLMLTHVHVAFCAGVPGTNDAAADTSERRRPAVPIGWGRIPGHETAFCDRLPFLLTTEVPSPTI